MRTNARRLFALLMTMMLLVAGLPGAAVAADDNPVADTSTLNGWQGYAGANSTQYVGRVWTDKSVSTSDVALTGSGNRPINIKKSDDADFLVGLSALSSTMKNTAQISVPLDIVLVLDVSGSMDDPLNDYNIVYASEMDKDATYYIIDEWYGYREITYREGSWGYRGWGGWTSITPKTDADSEGTQCYSRNRNSKLVELKSAVGSFLDAVSDANGQAADDKKHQVGLVTFASLSSIEHHLTDNTAEVASTVDGLTANGATDAGAGMGSAITVMNRARTNAKKVVIFFTDGVPTTRTSFNDSVANEAIDNAKTLKDEGTTIYTIGIFSGADSTVTEADEGSDETTRANAYMHAVSSNYPQAEFYYSHWNHGRNGLGERAANSDYYKSTNDAGELNTIFKDIFETEGANAVSPIVSTEGGSAVGYIEFTDQLGDYMEVKDFNAIVYGDTAYTEKTSYSNNGVTTYVFEQVIDGNEVYGPANLEDVIIQVTKSDDPDDPKVGDRVTVKIPATAIPMRYYEVDTDLDGNTSMDVTAAYPIRVFFSVGTKIGKFGGVSKSYAAALEDGTYTSDTTFASYVSENVGTDGKLSFYSNDWGESSAATAQFIPATDNNFYYFTADTPIYANRECTIPLNSNDGIELDTYYYYKNVYYKLDNGNTLTVTDEPVAFLGSLLDTSANGNTTTIDGNLYVRAGTQKTNRHRDFLAEKKPNTTGTYANSYEPAYIGDTTMEVKLGNNGKLSVDAAGNLSITKRVSPATGYITLPENVADEEFAFTVETLTASTYYTVKYSTADTTKTIQTDANGVLSFSLQKDQTITIYGLPIGTTYTVKETLTTAQTNAGYTSTTTDTKMTISATENSLTWANTYAPKPATLDGETALKVRKTLDGRDWRTGETYTFKLTQGTIGADGKNPVAVLPGTAENEYSITTTITVADPTDTKGIPQYQTFGQIKFTQEGVYTFTVTEVPPASGTAGMTYDTHAATITVTVEDDGNGQLVIRRVENAEGPATDPEGAAVYAVYANTGASDEDDAELTTVAAFTNTYAATGTLNGEMYLKVTKNLTGRDWANGDSFTFTLTAAAGTPMPEGSATEGDGTWTSTIVIDNSDVQKSKNFGDIKYTEANLGKTYTYTIKEVLPQDDDAETEGIQSKGVTYDETVYTVTVKVRYDATNGLTLDVMHDEGFTQSEDETQTAIFTNRYAADNTTLASGSLKVSKTLTGRDWRDSDAFKFKLTGQNGAPMPAEGGETVTIKGSDDTKEASFGAITYTLSDLKDENGNYVGEKTFTYTIREDTEKLPAGVRLDGTSSYEVKVVLKDNGNGTLSLQNEDGSPFTATTSSFTNTYQGDQDVVTITGSKSLTGDSNSTREPAAGEFSFTISSVDEGGNPRTGTPLPQETKVTNAAGGSFAFESITFTANHVSGSPYYYQIVEEEGRDGTMTYDKDVYTVKVEVTETPGENGAEIDAKISEVKKGDETVVTPEGDPGPITFSNIYDPVDVTLDGITAISGTKTLKGRDMAENERFTFTLTPATGDGFSIEENGTTATASGGADGAPVRFSFGAITFSKVGTYTFTLKETVGSAGGVTYDTHECTVTVTVKDNNGTLQADVSYAGDATNTDGTANNFVNTYGTTGLTLSGDTALKVQKTLSGRNWLTNDSFTFTLELTSDNETNVSGLTEGKMTATISAPGTLGSEVQSQSFGAITFNAPGTYTFNVTEDKPADDDDPDTAGIQSKGVTYDAHTTTITVVVRDNGEGKLKLVGQNPAYSNDGASEADKARTDIAAFTNTYTANPDTVNIPVTKVLNGYEWSEPDASFQFTLSAEDGTPMPFDAEEGAKTIIIDGQTANHTASFGEIEYGMEHIGRTYTYTITENTPTENPIDGMHYSKAQYQVNVRVTDGGAGDLTVVADIVRILNDDGTNYVQSTRSVTTGQAIFTNVVKLAELEGNSPTDAALKIEKRLAGRAWLQDDQFCFTLVGTDDFTRKSMSEGAGKGVHYTGKTVIVKDVAYGEMRVPMLQAVRLADDGELYSKKEYFRTLKFYEAGEYNFEIVEWDNLVNDPKDETNPDDVFVSSIADGYPMVFSKAKYQVQVVVTTQADGTLKIERYTMTRVADDTGAAVVPEEAVPDRNAVFVNESTGDSILKTVSTSGSDGSTKDAEGKTAGVGDILTYTINWINEAVDSDSDNDYVAATVTVTDKVPEGTEFVSASNGGTCENGIVTWNLGEQTAYAFGTVQFEVRVTEAAVKTEHNVVTNTATVSSQIGDNAPRTETTNETETYVPGKTQVIEGGQTGDVGLGQKLIYTIGYKNAYDQAATITITDKIPTGTKFVSAENGGVYDQATNTVTWTIANAAPDAQGTVKMTVEVTEEAESAPEGIKNQANVSYKVGDNDPAIDVKTNETTTDLNGNGSLTVSKALGGLYADYNDSFEFTVRMTKDGAPYTQVIQAVRVNGSGETTTLTLKPTEKGEVRFKLGHHDSVMLCNLPQGLEYAVREDGYEVIGYISSSTTPNGTIGFFESAQVTFLNARETPFPLTGDDSNPILWTALGLIAIASIGGVLVMRKRKKE